MKKNFIFICRCVSAAILLALSFPAMLQADETKGQKNSVDIYKAVDAYLDRQLYRLNIPGTALAIVEGTEIAHFYNFGEAGPSGEKPALTTPFILGSLTKSITAMAIMQLAEAGKLTPDAPVQQYLPWFKTADAYASAKITVRHLLNHTSGLSMFSGMKHLAVFDDSADACEQRIRELETFSPSRAPGEAFEYSDVNYNLLGLVIEAAGGERYDDYIEKHIFAPLGMVNSHTNQGDAVSDNMATGHTMRFGLTKPEPDLPRPTGSTPSGQLISSAGDMSRYMAAMLQGGAVNGTRVLSTESTAELVRPAVSAGSMGVDMGDYAMGWFIENGAGELRIWHDGMVPDFFSYMVLLPEQDRGLIFLVNANHMIVNYSLLDVSEAITDMLTNQPVETGDMGGVFRTLRLFLLLLLLQIFGIVFTVSRVRRWRNNPERRPGKAVVFWIYIIPASVFHFLIVVSAAALLFMGMTRFMMLFLPDLTGLLLFSGGISFIWIWLRILLIFRKAPIGSKKPFSRQRRPDTAGA